MNEEDLELIKNARQFDVHVWSEHSEINAALQILLKEIVDYRKEHNGKQVREPEKLWRNLKPIVLDLWIASRYEANPWIGIGLNEKDYQVGSRYKKLFLKYERVKLSIDTLLALQYIESSGFFHDPGTGKGRRTRYKATPKLIELINTSVANSLVLTRDVKRSRIDPLTGEITQETIQLKDENKKLMDYVDNELTIGMRSRLELINSKLDQTKITLRITDDQFLELQKICRNSQSDRTSINFLDRNLYRVFNNASFNDGGRFFGGWWIGLPKQFRPYIEINYGSTVELDFSGHHLRLLYALKGVEVNEVYDVEGYTTAQIKAAVFSLLNTKSRAGALKSLEKNNFEKPMELLEAIEARHALIKDQFYKNKGLQLMREDSDLAEEIMLRVLKQGGACLPIHDSFIVKASRVEELKQVMEDVFFEKYGVRGMLKAKATSRELEANPERFQDKDGFVTDNLNILLGEGKYFMYESIFDM